MFGSIGMGEIILIFGVALVVMGPEKFPGFAKLAMRTFRDLRGYIDEAKAEIAKEIQPVKKEMRELAKHKPEEYLEALAASYSDDCDSDDGEEDADGEDTDDPGEDSGDSDLSGDPYENYSEYESRWPSDSREDEAVGGAAASEARRDPPPAAGESTDSAGEPESSGESQSDDGHRPYVERLDG